MQLAEPQTKGFAHDNTGKDPGLGNPNSIPINRCLAGWKICMS